MGTLFYFLYILVVIGLYLTTTRFGILNISYGEFICQSNEEDLADNCGEISIMLDTDTPNTSTDGVISKPVRMTSEFLNDFGIEVVKGSYHSFRCNRSDWY